MEVDEQFGWHGRQIMCHSQFWKQFFKCHDIVSLMVEDNGELRTITLTMTLQLWQNAGTELSLSRDHNGKLAAGLGVRGLEQKMMENCAAKKIYACNLARDAKETMSWSKVLPNKSRQIPKEHRKSAPVEGWRGTTV